MFDLSRFIVSQWPGFFFGGALVFMLMFLYHEWTVRTTCVKVKEAAREELESDIGKNEKARLRALFRQARHNLREFESAAKMLQERRYSDNVRLEVQGAILNLKSLMEQLRKEGWNDDEGAATT